MNLIFCPLQDEREPKLIPVLFLPQKWSLLDQGWTSFFMFTGSSRTFYTELRLITLGEGYSDGWLGLFSQMLAF